jgi:FkbM family methyltransferase
MKQLKLQVQNAFRKLGIYERLKASCLYDFYWKIADSRIIRQRNREVDFYRDVLDGFRSGDLIFDIGANHGQKVDIFLRLGARVVAVEPDEFNQGVLRRKFLGWRITPKPVTIVGKAVSDNAVSQTMWVDAPGSAKNTLSSKWVETLRADKERFGERLDFAQTKNVQTTTLEELIAACGEPFFIKIDVEGYEPNVLRGLKRPVKFLSFEVNLPEFHAEGLECLDLLERISKNGRFNYTLDCQRGLELNQWIGFQEFVQVFNARKESCVEIFWSGPTQSKQSG